MAKSYLIFTSQHFIQLYIDGLFYNIALAVITNDTMNVAVQMSFQISDFIFFEYMPTHGIAILRDSYLCFLEKDSL